MKLWEPPYYDPEKKIPVEGNLNELAVTLMVISYTFCSVTNSSSRLIFVKIRAESGRIFSKNLGNIWAKIRAKLNFVIRRLFMI